MESGAVSADGRTAGLLLVLGEDDEESLSLPSPSLSERVRERGREKKSKREGRE